MEGLPESPVMTVFAGRTTVLQLLVACLVVLEVSRPCRCAYLPEKGEGSSATGSPLPVPINDKVRTLSREHREEEEALEQQIAELVRQLKLTPPGQEKEEQAVELRQLQQKVKDLREEYRHKLREILNETTMEQPSA